MFNIRDITIRRDVLSISFNRGTIAFLEPINGKVTGAVFIGSGEVLSIPSDPIEKLQLFKFTGAPVLNERFTAGFFRFTDDTYEEILKEYNDRAQEDVTDFETAQFVPWDSTLNDRSGLLSYRILAELLGRPDRPLFFAQLNGEKVGWLDVVYDPRMVEEVVILRTGENSVVSDTWASFNRRSESRSREASANESKAVFDILSYDLDATITSSAQLQAVAAVRLRALTEGDRVLSFDLSRFLRVSSVSSDTGAALPFFQHANMSEQEIRQYGANAFAIVLPEPLRAGQEITLRFSYSGEVIGRRGESALLVGERGSWYPNIGVQDRASFNLTFHYPAAYSLVATGNLTKEWDESGLRHSTWSSDGEISLAGFNLGDFRIVAEEGTPAIFVTAQEGAEGVLNEVRGTVQYLSDLLGPFPFKRLSISHLPLNVSSSWPSLVYLAPDITMDPAQGELVRAHAIAQQWFRNKIAPRSYHDQWLTEGFSIYAGAMYVQGKYPDTPHFRAFLNDAKLKLLELNADGTIKESAGPMWLGYRLSSSLTPDGYPGVLQSKATWVVHMLRTLMPEGAFESMVKEFLETNRGKLVTTFDLKQAAEKHMGHALDLRGDRKLDWFFDQWVFGTGIPGYTLEYKVEPVADGFLIDGLIKQSDVSEDFIMPVPVYADETLLGTVVVDAERGNFSFTVKDRPTTVVIDPHATILRR